MEHDDDELGQGSEHKNEDGQVPSTLLPDVLRRLGLAPGQAAPVKGASDLVARLKSDDWETRVATVRALERLESGMPVELLISALHDEDGAVRAAAVHALGIAGEQAPLDQLIAATHDTDWHVRETALLALGMQERTVPDEVFVAALNDTDSSVRGAARLALQWTSAQDRSSVSYGRLWEKKRVQQQDHEQTIENTAGTESYASWNGATEYNRGGERMQEQAQEYIYAPQGHEYVPFEHDRVMPSRWDKATSTPPRQSHKWLWIIVAATALIFLALGSVVGLAMPRSFFGPEPVLFRTKKDVWPSSSLRNPPYANIIMKEVSEGLKLSPDQITMDLREGKSMSDIAVAQGVSAFQLRNIELKALNDALNAAVKAGDLNQDEANGWVQDIPNDSLDKIIAPVFLAGQPGQ